LRRVAAEAAKIPASAGSWEVRGMELGQKGSMSLEIISVGPQFRELDFRELSGYTKKAPFFRKTPLAHGRSG